MNYVQVLEQLVEAQLRPPVQWVQGNTREFLLHRDAEKPLLLLPMTKSLCLPSSSTMPDLRIWYLERSKTPQHSYSTRKIQNVSGLS